MKPGIHTRRYEVAFRTELDDRGVERLADELFDLGFDDICFRPLYEPVPDVDVSTIAPVDLTKLVDHIQTTGEEQTIDLRGAVDVPVPPREHYSRADTTRDRDALRDALQHETQRGLKW